MFEEYSLTALYLTLTYLILQRITKAREMAELFQRYQKSHNHSEVEPYSAPSPLSPSATEDPGKYSVLICPTHF